METNVPDQSNYVAAERARIIAESERREREIDPDLYAPWQPAMSLMAASRRRIAARALKDLGAFPRSGQRCLEVGFGSLGWLGDLIGWGVRETDLYGLELNPSRVRSARYALPGANLCIGDASALPWPENYFSLVVASTVFTSILDSRVRRGVANEITRVLVPKGALLWYDFAVNNPANPNVRAVKSRELKRLFPDMSGRIFSCTLAPPVARFVTPRSWVLATMLEGIPLFRSHLLAVFIKKASQEFQ